MYQCLLGYAHLLSDSSHASYLGPVKQAQGQAWEANTKELFFVTTHTFHCSNTTHVPDTGKQNVHLLEWHYPW